MALSTASQPLSLVRQVVAARQEVEAAAMEDEALLHSSTSAQLETTCHPGTPETACLGSAFRH